MKSQKRLTVGDIERGQPTIGPRVKEVEALPNYRIRLFFDNDEVRIFDVTPYLDKGVFKALKDTDLFEKVCVSGRTAAWPVGLDISPDVLYSDSELDVVTTLNRPNRTMSEPINLFYSYSSRDEEFREQLETHLSILKRRDIISEWHFRMIPAGSDWKSDIKDAIASTHLFLMLVSSDFIASDYCYDIELKQALARRARGEAEVIPIILRPVDLEGTPLFDLQALPTDARPISTWENQDEAWLSVAKGIRLVCDNLLILIKEDGSKEETFEKIAISEEDFGLLDFMAELEVGVESATDSMNIFTEQTNEVGEKIQEKVDQFNKLKLSPPPNASQQARRLAGSMASEFARYATSVEGIALELSAAWDKVDIYFPKAIERIIAENEENIQDLPALKNSIISSRDSIHLLREHVSSADEHLNSLGGYSATLKVGVSRARKSLRKLVDVYWTIENSLNQMILRIDNILE